MVGENFSAERMAEVYLDYLFRKKADSRHVRRVASWLGLLVLGIEKIKDQWWVSHTRQLCFEADGRRFKARFNHNPRPGGGIEFVEVEATRGQPEKVGGATKMIRTLSDAEKFYKKPSL